MIRINTCKIAPAILIAATLSAAAQDKPVAPMVLVKAGEYPLGANDGPASNRPRHLVRLRAFRIDRFEVTNAQFAKFLNTLDVRIRQDRPSRGSLRPGDLGGSDATRLFRNRSGKPPFIELDDDDAQIVIKGGKFMPAAGSESRPVPEVTWIGAVAYCRWRGARLPTEAEWEAAARGESDRPYPWGSKMPDSQRAVFARDKGLTANADSMPASATPTGIFHMAGNLAEWTSSLVRPYPYRADDGRENPASNGERITRGGDHTYDIEPDKLKVTFPDGYSRNPAAGHRHIGFRCAADAH